MNFKENVLADLDSVFFNVEADEFADVAILEGEQVNIILDEDRLKERQGKKGQEGVHNEELLFYVVRSSISFYPRPDNTLLYYDCKWLVVECYDDMGMFTIKAKRVSG